MPARRIHASQIAISTLSLIPASPAGDVNEFHAAFVKLAELECGSVAHLRLIGTNNHFHYFQEMESPYLFEVPVSPG